MLYRAFVRGSQVFVSQDNNQMNLKILIVVLTALVFSLQAEAKLKTIHHGVSRHADSKGKKAASKSAHKITAKSQAAKKNAAKSKATKVANVHALKNKRAIEVARGQKEQKRKALARRQVEIARKIAAARKAEAEAAKRAPKFQPPAEKTVAKNGAAPYKNRSEPDSFGNGLIKRVPAAKKNDLSFDKSSLYSEADEFKEDSSIDLDQKLERNVAKEDSGDFKEVRKVSQKTEEKNYDHQSWLDESTAAAPETTGEDFDEDDEEFSNEEF